MSVFVNQTLLTIVANTGYDDLESATVTRILYEKPNGDTGAFDATVDGTTLVYQITDGDIDMKGTWTFQAFWTVNGLDGYGKKKRRYFEKPITV